MPQLGSVRFIFPKMKQHFKGPYYTSDDEVKTAVWLLFQHRDAHVYQERLTKLLEHWQKCVQHKNDYVEKQMCRSKL